MALHPKLKVPAPETPTSRPSVKFCWTPAADRNWLFLTAGGLWTGVGLALVITACVWLASLPWPGSGWAAATGLVTGAVVYRWGFSRIAARNIRRILSLPPRVCFFAFQAWRSYLLIVFMMALGHTLRHAPLPRILLAVLYLTIGTGLTLSSALYYEEFM